MAKEFLVKGGTCMCKFGTTPGKFAVPDNTFFKMNGNKLAGTTMSLGNTFDPPGFGVCKVNPLSPKPCTPAVTRWEKPYPKMRTSAGGYLLTDESSATCSSGCPGCITVIHTGQIPVPGAADFRKASALFQADLDPMGEPAGLTEHQIPFRVTALFATLADDIEVESIKIITPLDSGSANKGGNSLFETQSGLIYGKTYELEIDKFKNTKSNDYSLFINWKYSYVADNGETVYGSLVPVGKNKASIKIDNREMLGKHVTFHAYIKNKKQGAELKQWIHYQFRHFDRETVRKELDERKRNPWKIDQGYTSLCGMAGIMYVLSKTNPNEYEKAVLDLHRTGQGTVSPPPSRSGRDYTLKPHRKAEEAMYDMNPFDTKTKTFPESLSQADWLALAVLRSKFSFMFGFGLYCGKKEEDKMDSFRAVNWPGIMTRLCRELLFFTIVEQVGMLNVLTAKTKHEQKIADEYEKLKELPEEQKSKSDETRLDKLSNELHRDLKRLLEIDALYREGYTIFMLIDSQMLDNKVSYEISDLTKNMHWIVYEGSLLFSDDKGNPTWDFNVAKFVRFKIYTWGEKINSYGGIGYMGGFNNGRGISVKAFRSNYYYYIKCKHPLSSIIDSPVPLPPGYDSFTRSGNLT